MLSRQGRAARVRLNIPLDVSSRRRRHRFAALAERADDHLPPRAELGARRQAVTNIEHPVGSACSHLPTYLITRASTGRRHAARAPEQAPATRRLTNRAPARAPEAGR